MTDILNGVPGPEETTQLLSLLLLYCEDWASGPSTRVGELTNVCNSSARVQLPLLAFMGTCMHTLKNTHVYKYNFFKRYSCVDSILYGFCVMDVETHTGVVSFTERSHGTAQWQILHPRLRPQLLRLWVAAVDGSCNKYAGP